MAGLNITNLLEDLKSFSVERRAAGEATKVDFIQSFMAGRTLSQDELAWCAREQIWRMAKTFLKEARATAGTGTSRQLVLPMSMSDYDIPAALILTRDDAPVAVPTVDATLEDCERHIEIIRSNIDCCMRKLTDFVELVRAIKPLIDANPDWRVGDALRAMLDAERERKR